MPSANITALTNLATPQPTMLMYAALSPFDPTADRKVTANALLSTITANISDISLQFDDGLGTATVAAAGKGKIRYNNTTKTFQASVDGGAYATLGGGGMSIGGTVTGGTTGSVLFVGAGPVLAQDNATFFWDTTNKRLGIGTTTPAQQIHVLSTTATEARILIENSNGVFARLALKSNTREWNILVGGSGTSDNGVWGVFDVTGGGGAFPFAIQSGHRAAFNLDPSSTFTSTLTVIALNAGEPTLTLNNHGLGGSTAQILNLLYETATNNAVSTVIVTDVAVFGAVGANGLGGSQVNRATSTTTVSRDMTALQWLWTNATDASRSAAMAIQVVDNAAALAEKWRIAGNGSGSGTLETLTGVNGSQWINGEISELLTLSTVSTTTDTTMQLPANSIILSVTTRVTTTITTAVSFSVGDPTTAARFSASAGGLTAGSTRVGLQQMQGSVTTDATGPVQTTAASVRITTNANPGAGVIRITINYMQFVAPTS